MESVTIDTLKERMNEGGRLGRPLLFAINFEMDEAILVEKPLQSREILFDIDGTSNVAVEAQSIEPIEITSSPIPYSDYAKSFATIQDALKRGDTFLANLTVATPITCNASLEEIFHQSRAKYRICIPDRFCCFSPETFVKISSSGTIRSFPMKGTIDAMVPDAEQKLLTNEKEQQEHNTIVDLIRNGLSQVATNVRLERFRYIERVESNKGAILQASSEIAGELAPKYENYREHLGDIIVALLPAGSISGAPKHSTIEAIRRAEATPRGFYTGIVGYFDGERLDTAVMIRYIERDKKDGTLRYRSGGGITTNSSCESEYDEVQSKIYIPINNIASNGDKKEFIETIKIIDGEAQLINLHQERATRTATAHSFTPPQIGQEKIESENPHKNGTTKCRIVYSSKGVSEMRFEPYTPRKIERLKIVESNNIDYSHKKLDRTALDELRKKAGAQSNEEVIIVRNGFICDTSYSNLLFIGENGELHTPTTYLLNGVKRQELIAAGIVKEREITINDIAQYKSIALINAMLDVEDIVISTKNIVTD